MVESLPTKFLLHCYQFSYFLEHMLPKSRIGKFRKNCFQQLINHHPLLPQAEIKNVDELFPQDYHKYHSQYLSKGRPVILRNAAQEWPSGKKWNLNYFKTNFGETPAKIVARRGISTPEDFFKPQSQDMEYSDEYNLKEYIKRIEEGGKQYLRFHHLLDSHPELLEDLDRPFLRSLRYSFSKGECYQIFIGPSNTFTPTHAAIVPGLFIMVSGEKEWLLAEPRYLPWLHPQYLLDEYCSIDGDLGKDHPVPIMRAHIKAGDILYFPPWMFHQVRNIGTTIGVRYGFPAFYGALKSSMTLTAIRVLFAKRSILRVLYYGLFNRNLLSRENDLLTPKIHFK